MTGCATTHNQDVSSYQDGAASIKLAEAASTVSQSLVNVAAIQRATTSPLVLKNLSSATSPDLQTLASVDWSGPVGPLVKKVGDAAGYTVRVLGVAPAIPVLVSITAKNVPLAYILRNADYQSGSKANIVIFPNMKVIELRYARS